MRVGISLIPEQVVPRELISIQNLCVKSTEVMAAKRIEIMDIRQLLQLKLGGHSNRKIALLTGIHRNSVNVYVQQLQACEKPFEALLSLSDAELNALFASNGTIQKERYEALSRTLSTSEAS